MCGIHASISTKASQAPSDGLKNLLCRRGPDHTGQELAQVPADDGTSYWITLTSTVLALRGGHVVAQPFVESSTGSVLCWNGEAWRIGSDPVVGNDGKALFDILVEASSAETSAADSTAAVLRILRSIAGPFAFVFLDGNHGQVYFGRDRLGRRSLLYNQDSSRDVFELSSIASAGEEKSWHEVEADGVYQLSCRQNVTSAHTREFHECSISALAPVQRHPWVAGVQENNGISLGNLNKAVPSKNHTLNVDSHSVERLRHYLRESLNLRVLNIPLPPEPLGQSQIRMAVLFSGGLDCTVLARMAHEIISADQQIDLINVAFENPRVVQAAKNAAISRLHAGKAGKQSENQQVKECVVDNDTASSTSAFESCPDRETGRKAFQELQSTCPGRVWRFVAVNVPYSETIAHRPRIISLIYPHNTEMDLSIACALYFAARGTGIATSSSDPSVVPYSTPARVLLSGLGADELFGGYTRHETAFRRLQFPGLLDELKLDVDRLGKRNLGRDDRVISNWSREARFPYLDEHLVKWAVECPIWEKCGFQLEASDKKEIPDIEPGKKVLRLLAYKLGLHSVSMEKKRAIQFGARTAKMEVGRTKGTALIS